MYYSDTYGMTAQVTQDSMQNLLYQLFVSDIGHKEAAQIIDILKFKRVFPLVEPDAGPGLIEFLQNFWNWDTSPYIQERLLHKNGIHRQYVARCAAAVRNYWLPWFGKSLPLQLVSRQDIQSFVISFRTRTSPASAQGRNDIIRSGTVALRWAFHAELIPHDVTAGLTYYSGGSPEVVILPPEVVRRLFGHPWKHKKAMTANKLAMLTGLRSGEIQALRGCDIGDDRLYIRHSWNALDGLKTPKNGETRTAYVPFPDILEDMRSFAGSRDGFVFCGRNDKQPMDAKCWLRELRQELRRIHADEDLIQQIHFHSWRHYFTVYMKNRGNLEPRLLQRMTGHKTISMMEYYADHPLDDDELSMKEAALRVFSPLLPGYGNQTG